MTEPAANNLYGALATASPGDLRATAAKMREQAEELTVRAAGLEAVAAQLESLHGQPASLPLHNKKTAPSPASSAVDSGKAIGVSRERREAITSIVGSDVFGMSASRVHDELIAAGHIKAKTSLESTRVMLARLVKADVLARTLDGDYVAVYPEAER